MKKMILLVLMMIMGPMVFADDTLCFPVADCRMKLTALGGTNRNLGLGLPSVLPTRVSLVCNGQVFSFNDCTRNAHDMTYVCRSGPCTNEGDGREVYRSTLDDFYRH